MTFEVPTLISHFIFALAVRPPLGTLYTLMLWENTAN